MIDLLRLGFDKRISAEGLAESLRPHASDIPSEDLDRLAAVLEQFLRTVPDALATALGMSKDPYCGRAVAFATGAILTYLFDEEDLLPEASYGLVGMLDDAYLVHGFVTTLRGGCFPLQSPRPWRTQLRTTACLMSWLPSSRKESPRHCGRRPRA